MNLIFKNPLTAFGLAIILVLMLTAVFAPFIARYALPVLYGWF